jgi:hypothetical protein
LFATQAYLQQRLAVLVFVLVLELDLELLEQTRGLLLLVVHDDVEHLVDRVQHIHDERTLVVVVLGLGPLAGLRVEEALAPQPVHQLHRVDLELLSVHLGELLERERPAVQARAETDAALAGVDLQSKGNRALLSATLRGCHSMELVECAGITGIRKIVIPSVLIQ